MAKKEKAKKPKKTAKQRAIIALKVLICIIVLIGLAAAVIAIINTVAVNGAKELVSNIEAIDYDEKLTPTLDEDGYYSFSTDRDLKVVQLTDVHIGAGMMSSKNDSMAINAVAAMLTEEKPDLVIVTGDIAYPVPFQAGTFNNKNGAEIFAQLMEKLGVYWCLGFGNHDTESYSFYSREQISAIYSDHEKYPHCLFQSGPEDVDGCGNYLIKVRNYLGEITQGFIIMDSHSYVDNDYLGILWKYDCVHKNQVEWYEQQIKALTDENYGIQPKTMLFFHIPPPEMRTAYNEYRDNGFADTEDTKYLYGKAGEKDLVVFTSEKNYGLFDKCVELGSTQAIFFGHDHLNNFAVNYKGMQMSYGMSIDYLAYPGIAQFGSQRGCTVITVSPNGSMKVAHEGYYQDKYSPVNEKETVSMDDYYSESERSEENKGE